MPCLGRAVSHPAHPAPCRDEGTIRNGELGTPHRRGIVGERHAADVHRLGFRIEQFKPVRAGGRFCHPLVEDNIDRFGQRDRF